MNFKNYGNEPPAEGGGGGGRMPGNIPLASQSSIYSLTFDELQSTMGGIGKDFGSMNMDELLKNIWSAEDTQTMGYSAGGGAQQGGNGYLQRQGSLTLPRTLSHKTVDEVWRDMAKEYGASAGGKESNLNLPQRQQTLGEMTLEEFLVRAGVVKEDVQLPVNSNNSGFFGDLSRPSNNSGLGFGFQQMDQSRAAIGSRIPETSNQAANLPLNLNEARSVHQQPQQIFPKQPNLANANPMPISNSTQLASPGIRGEIVGIADSSMNSNLVQNAGLPAAGMGMIGLGTGAVIVPTGSPAVSSDGLGKSNGDTSSVSPAPYVFNGGLRGRRSSNAVEKVIERRQRRMIKNRESAARSRARKQAYTTELEAEVAKLKEQNQELRKKQEEMMEMQKNQVLEMMNMQQGVKRPCLRRTQTGPW